MRIVHLVQHAFPIIFLLGVYVFTNRYSHNFNGLAVVACCLQRDMDTLKATILDPAMIIIVFSAHEIPIVCKGAGHSVGALKALD